MKKLYFIIITALLALTASGCGKKNSADHSGYLVYCTNAAHTRLLTETAPIDAEKTEALVGELINRMAQPVMTAEHYSVIPEEVRVTGYLLADGQLTLTFSDSYLRMDNAAEILLRAGMVLTMSQLPEVRTVVFHIGENGLRDSSGEPVGAMTGSMFINNPVGINSYQYASLSLYFAGQDGDTVVREMRNVHYSSNTTLARVVMEQLLKGPINEQLRPIIDPEVDILNIAREDDLCTVNLGREFLSFSNAADLKPEVTIYGIVNSLCDVLNVNRVQFQVEGESDVLYRDTLSLNGPFHRNSELIETAENVERGDGSAAAQPSVGL